MSRNRILMTCAIASLALGLSACSSDDDAPLAMMPPEVAPEPAPTAAEMLTAAQLIFDAAQEAVDNLAADATPEEVVAAHGELAVAGLALTAAENLPENQPAPTAAEMLTAAQLIFDAAQEAVDNLAADATATPEQVGAAATELRAAELALTEAENLPENIAASQPVPLTALEVAQEAARDAADLAGTAATTAEAAATAAKEAATGRARFQTIVPSSYKHAHSSQTHANLARAGADAAQTAATAAAADAATLSDAIRAQLKAEELKESAESHQEMAESSRDDAVEVAATEVFIGDADGDPMYRVGDTAIVLDGEERSNTVGDVTRTTGRRDNIIETKTLRMVTGVMPVAATDDAAAVIEIVDLPMRRAHIDIGEMYDSLEDNARLWLVDAYAGTKTVNLFQRPAGLIDDRQGTADKICRVDCTGEITATTETWPLTPVHGAFLLQPTTGAVTTEIPPADVADSDVPRAIFYYRPVDEGGDPVEDDNTLTALDESLVYVEQDVITSGGETTYQYDQVTVTLGVDFPETTAFEYISYGIWTSLDEETGNKLAALGTGFVDGGDNMTAVDDMPNIGDATYNGNWVATVQAADPDGDGDITSWSNTASIVADFDEGDITVNLDMLAELTGDITDNTFMGTEATTVATPMGRVAGGEDFTGNFHGGFFGDRAAEAGGVFDFRSDDNEDGGFTGAFGGAR